MAKAQYESVVQQSIQSMLDDTLGPRRAVARVSTSRDRSVHIDAPERIIHTSVVVLVNSAPQTSGNPPPGAAAPSQLTPANVQLIRNAVIAAADLNIAQGDEVSVELVPFRRGLAPFSRAPLATGMEAPVWILAVLGGMAVLGTLALVAMRVRSLVAPKRGQRTAPAVENPPLPIPPAGTVTREHMIEYVAGVARENPESIAKLVKLWLAE
jgi:flagellar biosynthesis/type III secretory pathway M-ring protein FliF/YscJ